MSTYPAAAQPHYVYRCYDDIRRLIYVGCTVSPASRLAHHQLNTWWGDQIASIRCTVWPDRPTARMKESEAIARENPRWNVKGRWATAFQWTADDFADYYRAASLAPDGPITPPTEAHLKRVAAAAFRRFGVDVTEVAA